ncbi:Peptidyl-prolyl isomerase cwc27 [Rhizina undulata]
MASQYILEPQTNAKVILHTSLGPLDLELWTTQTPLTSRNFLQLCLDGYYNDTIFHRLVPGFILQGGDPTGTGHGGEAIYQGGLFADEFHSRLRFNRRGLVGMANSGRKDDNGSQFFLTLGDTKELTGKNTLFGKVVGDTIFNLVRMGEGEIEEGTERPVYPIKIASTEVVINPFEDMKPRENKRKLAAAQRDAEKAKKKSVKKKPGKQLLSFGDDEPESASAAPAKKKPKFDTRLVVAAPEQQSVERPHVQVEERRSMSKPSTTVSNNATTTTETATKTVPENNRSPSPPPPPRNTQQKEKKKKKQSPSPIPSRSPSPGKSKSEIMLEKTNAQIEALKQSLHRSGDRDADKAPSGKEKRNTKFLAKLQKEFLPPTSVKGRKRKRGKNTADYDEDDESYEFLRRFQQKLQGAASAATSKPDDDDVTPEDTEMEMENAERESGRAGDPVEDDDEAMLCDLHFVPGCKSCRWYETHSRSPSPSLLLNESAALAPFDMAVRSRKKDISGKDLWNHTLSFEKDRLGKDLTWKRKNEEELVVIDPREKGKEIREGKRRERWADGRGAFRKGREWDTRGPERGEGSGSGRRGGGR